MDYVGWKRKTLFILSYINHLVRNLFWFLRVTFSKCLNLGQQATLKYYSQNVEHIVCLHATPDKM